MSELSQIVNAPIELDINGVKIKAKKASVYDFAIYQDYLKAMNEVNPDTVDYKALPYALYLCVRKVNSDVTQEEISDFLPIDLILEKPDLVKEIMTKLGFILPLNPKK